MREHVFLLTKLAYFLSIIPSFSSGNFSNNFCEITKPKTRSPRNSTSHYFLNYLGFYESMQLLKENLS